MVRINILALSTLSFTTLSLAQQITCLFPGQDDWGTDIVTEDFDKTVEELCGLYRSENAVTKSGMDPLGIFRSHREGGAVWSLSTNWESDCSDSTEYPSAQPNAEWNCERIFHDMHSECTEGKDSRGAKLHIGECAFWRYEAV